MLRPPVVPKKRTLQDPPEIVTPAWLEALTNRKVAATPQAPARPNPGMGRMVDGGRYGTYNSNKWGGLYGTLVDVARVGDFLIRDPAESLWRTAKGENVNTAFNPNSGASLTERIGAFGEDALNIASAIPAMGAVDDLARAAGPAVKNFQTSLAAKRAARAEAAKAAQGWTSLRMQPYEYAPPRLEAIRREIGEAGADLSMAQQDSFVRPGNTVSYTRSVDRPEWKQNLPEGVKRFWHTNQQGGRLPEKLASMLEASRMPGRRGSGATQAFSGGPYATDSGKMSLTYFDDVLEAIAKNSYPSSVMPENFVDQLFPGYGIYDQAFTSPSNLPSGMSYSDIGREIRELQLNDFKNQYVGLNARANSIPFNSNSPYYGQDFGNMTVKELLDSVDTPEEARAIIQDSLRPIVFKRDPESAVNRLNQKLGDKQYSTSYDKKEAMLNEEITFRHPVVKGPQGTYTKNAVVDPYSGLYLSGDNLIPETMPFSQGYFNQLDNLAAQYKVQKINEHRDMLRRFGRTPDEIEQAFTPDFFDSIDKDNPYLYVKNQGLDPKFQMGTTNVGGQNYWDLPITQNADGSIEFVGDLKAIDIRTSGGSKETFENLANEWKDFIYQNYPGLANDQAVNNLLAQLKDLYKSSSKTKGYFHVQNDLTGLINQEAMNLRGTAFHPDNDLMPKEEFYDFLANRGYGVIPHTGGEIMSGDVQHLAMNFLKPEALPSSEYVAGAGTAFSDPLARLARARAMQTRYAKSNSTGREFGDFLNKQKLTEAAKQARLAGIQSMLVGSANNTARNR
jgi:hypothetical protein